MNDDCVVVVPTGRLVIHPKWNRSELMTKVRAKVEVMMMGELGAVDFFTSTACGVVYLPESDLMMGDPGSSYKHRCSKLHQSTSITSKFVIMEATARTQHLVTDIQRQVVVRQGMKLMICDNLDEVCKLLMQMVQLSIKSSKSPFSSVISHDQPLDSHILKMVCRFKGVGPNKARALLDRFKSIHGIIAASESHLAEVVGIAAARSIHQSLRT